MKNHRYRISKINVTWAEAASYEKKKATVAKCQKKMKKTEINKSDQWWLNYIAFWVLFIVHKSLKLAAATAGKGFD